LKEEQGRVECWAEKSDGQVDFAYKTRKRRAVNRVDEGSRNAIVHLTRKECYPYHHKGSRGKDHRFGEHGKGKQSAAIRMPDGTRF